MIRSACCRRPDPGSNSLDFASQNSDAGNPAGITRLRLTPLRGVAVRRRFAPNPRPRGSLHAIERGNTATANAKGTLDFGTIDKNSDGAVTKAEAMASKNKALAKAFDKLDANHDGRLDSAEFAQFEAGAAVTTPPSPLDSKSQ